MELHARRRREEGSIGPDGHWHGPVHGQVAVLTRDGDALLCHVCGRWYRALGNHAALVHRIPAADYRALFGLRAGTALVGTTLRAARRQRNAAALRPFHARPRGVALAMPPERRRAYNLGRRLRLESRLDPANRDRWDDLTRRGREALRARREGAQPAAGAAS